MAIALLGPLQIDDREVLEPRDRVALEVLAVRRGQIVSPGQLAEALWADDPPGSWAKQVQICISRLRKVLGPDAIVTTAGGYRLQVEDADLDVGIFESQIARSRTFLATGELDRAAASYARAISLWRGNPYEDLDGWGPGRTEVDRLLELRRSAEEEWLEALLATGDHRAVSVEALKLVAEEPLRERRWHTLALAHYRSGRQADALRSLSTARKTLREELGIDPGQDLVDLEEAILRQDPAISAVPESVVFSDKCPYKGLAPYDIGDQDSFFGREGEVAECLRRLRSTPLLVLAGPSGSGKSSLARAGLAAALDRSDRPVVVFTPDRDPSEAMTSAIASLEPPPTLVVDQFEEVFTLDLSEQDIGQFCDRLTEYATDTAQVIIAIRSDYLGGLVVSPALSRLAEQGLHLVAPLVGNGLRDAIKLPASQAGLRLEHGLVELLERDTEGEPGSLPLLSHALAETWRRRDGQALTVEGYRASGGIQGAVAQSADRLYESLSTEQREVLRSLLLRMVTPTVDGPPVRCRVPARSVLGDSLRDRVVTLLVRSRLVTAQEDSFEIAHEALARAWPRLQAWLEDDAEGQRIMRHLAARADDWDSLGRPTSELYRGARLESAIEWQCDSGWALTDVESDFLEASSSLFATEAQELAERARLEARHNRRLRVLLIATGVFLIVALVGVFTAVTGQRQAQTEALVNRSLSLRATDRAAAALLAVEAYRRSAGPGTWSALLSTFTASPGFMGYQYVPDADWLSGALIPGSPFAVVALDGMHLHLIDVSTGVTEAHFDPADLSASDFSKLVVSDDGRFIAQFSTRDSSEGCALSGPGCALVQVFDVGSGNRVMTTVPPFGIGNVAINEDGSLVAITGGRTGDLAVYRTATGQLIGTLAGSDPPAIPDFVENLAGVDFGPDGNLYLGSTTGQIRLIDPQTLTVLDTWNAPPFSSNNHVAVTSNGQVIGAGTQGLVALDQTSGVELWSVDLRDGRHPEPCPWFAVNATLEAIYCGNDFGVIEERSLMSGAPTGKVFDPQQGSVGSIEVSADGKQLFAFGADSPTVSSWRLDGSGPVQRLVAHGHVMYDGYNVDGSSLLVARRGQTSATWDEFSEFAIWDPESGEEIARSSTQMEGSGWAGPATIGAYLPAEDRIAYLAAASMEEVEGGFAIPTTSHSWFLSADGERIYLLMINGEVWTIDAETRLRMDPTLQAGGTPFSVTATADHERVVVSTRQEGDAVIRVFDGNSGDLVAETHNGSFVTAVSLTGTLVGASGGEIIEYDLETLERVGAFPGARGDVLTLKFSEAGDVLLAGSSDQTVSIFDVATRTRVGDVIPTFSPFIPQGSIRPDGKEIVVNQRDGLVLWDIDAEVLIEAACRVAGRNLSMTEWNSYMSELGRYRSTCPDYPES